MARQSRAIIHDRRPRVASIDHVGEPLGAVHPNLDGATDLLFEDLAPAAAAKGCDVALLALPHKITAAKVPELIAAGVKIVDMSGDFRLRDAATYEKFYGAKHPHPELLGTFVYGLPELNRAEIKHARYVATKLAMRLLPPRRPATTHTSRGTGYSGESWRPVHCRYSSRPSPSGRAKAAARKTRHAAHGSTGRKSGANSAGSSSASTIVMTVTPPACRSVVGAPKNVSR